MKKGVSFPLAYPGKKHKDLFKAILEIKNIDEAVKFFRDLLTISEIEEFSNRWQAARLLNKRLPYAKVAKETEVSTTTVSRVAHWLYQGAGGYRLILDRLSEKEERKS